MLKLLESLELLNKINQDSDIKEIYEVASKAFNNCNLCLEAAAILSKTIINEQEKIDFLLNAVKNAQKEIEINNINDIDVLHSLLRGYFEIGCLYLEYGKYKQAVHYYELVKEFDKGNDFQIGFRLISLYAYFEDIKVEALYKELSITEDNFSLLKCDLPFLVYLYKQNRYDEFYKLLIKINNENKSLLDVLKGNTNEETLEVKQALMVLKNNSYLINSCPNLIQFIKEIVHD